MRRPQGFVKRKFSGIDERPEVPGKLARTEHFAATSPIPAECCKAGGFYSSHPSNMTIINPIPRRATAPFTAHPQRALYPSGNSTGFRVFSTIANWREE